MAAGTASRWIVEPGGREEFVGAVKKAKSLLEPLGAMVALRQVQSGGDTAGQITLVLAFESELKRAEVLQQANDQRLLTYFGNLVQGPNPPAHLLSRVWLNEVGGPGTMPVPKRLLQTLQFAIPPGQTEAGLAAFEAAQAKHQGMGADARAWRLMNAGPVSGTYLYGVQFDSLVENAEFWEKGRATGPLPLSDAVQAGALVPVSGALSINIEI